jgi:GNAT superfamily N-acetyltransferase
MRSDADRMAARFARGCRAFAHVVDGAVVSYGWLSAGREWVGELALHLDPVPGEAYVWNCFTLEAHRRRGHYRRVLQGIVSVARSEGLRRLWIGSVDVPAEKADEDAGFERVLRFDVTHDGTTRTLAVSAAPGADEALADVARHRLGLRGWTDTGPMVARFH